MDFPVRDSPALITEGPDTSGLLLALGRLAAQQQQQHGKAWVSQAEQLEFQLALVSITSHLESLLSFDEPICEPGIIATSWKVTMVTVDSARHMRACQTGAAANKLPEEFVRQSHSEECSGVQESGTPLSSHLMFFL